MFYDVRCFRAVVDEMVLLPVLEFFRRLFELNTWRVVYDVLVPNMSVVKNATGVLVSVAVTAKLHSPLKKA